MAEVLSSLTIRIHNARHRLMAGRPSEAFEALSDLRNESATLALVRGECLYCMGRFKEAEAEFEQALILSPNSPRTEILLELAFDMAELNRAFRPTVNIESMLGGMEKPIQFQGADNLSHASMEPVVVPEVASTDEIGLVSETLADLMIRQSKYDDARKVFIQLSRLNPDRYEYFRERIAQLDQRS